MEPLTPERVCAIPSSILSSPLSSPLESPLSSPLSMLSRSPSPPIFSSSPSPFFKATHRYPSPSSTMTSGSASPLADRGQDGPPPAKKQKITWSKERKTRYLDLENREDDDEGLLDRLVSVLQRKKKIVVIAGAGISVSAGIPDFRSSEGLFRTLKDKHKIKGGGKQLFDASVYRDNKSTAEFHKMVRDLSSLTRNAEPTAFHHMLATIAQEGRLMRLYTQNVDCIDTSMEPLATTIPLSTKGPWPVTVQVHGGLEKMQCTKCSMVSDFKAEIFQGPEPPCCEKCKEADHVRTSFAGKRSHGIGRLRPRMVLYHEYNPDDEAIGAVASADLRRVPDAVIVVGTSLKVPGVRRIVKELCQATRSKRDGFTAWLNLDPEPQGADVKDIWDLVVRGRSDDVASFANLPHWDTDEHDITATRTWEVSGSPEKEARRELELEQQRGTMSVLVDGSKILREILLTPNAKSRLVMNAQGLPTPSASPRPQSPAPRKEPKKAGTKQSTLNFGNATAANATAKAKAPTSKAKKATKGKPSKKAVEPAKKNLGQAFKTTKAIAAPSKAGKPADSSSRNADPISPSQLPALRPSKENVDPFVLKVLESEAENVNDSSSDNRRLDAHLTRRGRAEAAQRL